MPIKDPNFKKLFEEVLKETMAFFQGTYGLFVAWKQDEPSVITATSGKIRNTLDKKKNFSVKAQEFQLLEFEGFQYTNSIDRKLVNRDDPLSLIPEEKMETLILAVSASTVLNGKIYVVGTKKKPVYIPDDRSQIKIFRNVVSLALENYLLFRNLDLKQKSSLPSHIKKLELIGKSHSIKEINKMIELVSKGTSTVLIRGESGTGKEIVARLIHYLSDRNNEPFVRINCAAIPENLLESELFGHEKGSFTGAIARRIGKFEHANKGTIFLDEIGEIPQAIQVKLLNFLQEREFTRVGGNEMIKVNVRIVAATNKNLVKAIKNKAFREDLYYRLNVMPIVIPPLRDRLEDIPDLGKHFVKQFNEELTLRYNVISTEALFLLQKYHYPGNIRELENIIERAMVIGGGETVMPTDLPKEIFGLLPDMREEKDGFSYREQKSSLWDVERGIIERALRECNWNQSRSARELGISRNQLRYRLKKYKISIEKEMYD